MRRAQRRQPDVVRVGRQQDRRGARVRQLRREPAVGEERQRPRRGILDRRDAGDLHAGVAAELAAERARELAELHAHPLAEHATGVQPHARGARRLALHALAWYERAMPEPDFDKRGGLVTAIAQDAEGGQILMVAYMNREAWQHTLATGRATYWSTSRNALWVKGETSGHVQHVRELLVDCDADAVLLRVEQVGGVACHEGYASCFFRRVEGEDWRVVASRLEPPSAG